MQDSYPAGKEGRAKDCIWNYFVKIVAVPSDAENIGGMWYTAEGIEIGPVIWGSFAIIQEVVNDCNVFRFFQLCTPRMQIPVIRHIRIIMLI